MSGGRQILEILESWNLSLKWKLRYNTNVGFVQMNFSHILKFPFKDKISRFQDYFKISFNNIYKI